MISAIILAAGASVRMGKPKALLTIEGETFLQRIVRTLRSARVTETIIVLGSQAEEIQGTLQWFEGRVVINSFWQTGQLSSLITGVQALESETTHGCLVCPVDHPLFSHSVIVDLLQGFWTSGKNIIIPVYNGKRGHPVIFGKSLFPALHSASQEKGAKEVVHTHRDEILEVTVQEGGVLVNIDTPEQYQAVLRSKERD
ncbi:MAG: nucleotidyltransferase family protein [Bacteroidetes bacterium]|nr:MAG: nucleotidyltransferase family protein [Bacteroidota bacterium]